MRSPREMGLGEIEEYLGQVVREGASPEKLKMYVAGLKFLYGVTSIGRWWPRRSPGRRSRRRSQTS
jgi:hypothetical protein